MEVNSQQQQQYGIKLETICSCKHRFGQTPSILVSTPVSTLDTAKLKWIIMRDKTPGDTGVAYKSHFSVDWF